MPLLKSAFITGAELMMLSVTDNNFKFLFAKFLFAGLVIHVIRRGSICLFPSLHIRLHLQAGYGGRFQVNECNLARFRMAGQMAHSVQDL
jgi:hypothetical protein